MFATWFAAALTLSPGMGVPYSPPAVLNPPPPYIEAATIVNFVTPVPGGSIPNFYPLVPQPVVIAHPDWYSYPGPAYWYSNKVTPYHPVVHAAKPVVPAPPKK